MLDCKLIAEIGINHNGDLTIVKQLMDTAKAAGCWGVKFQKRTVEAVYTEEELDRPRESPWGTTNREQKMGLEFGSFEYGLIDDYARSINLRWFASPWDSEAVGFLADYTPEYMKVASASLTDMAILEEIKFYGSRVILSVGMSTKKELDIVLDYLEDQVEYILACTSTYPTKDEEMNLNHILTLKKEYPTYKIGFSNHSPGIIHMCVACALGAEMLEFHVTLDRAMYGSDQAASIEVPGILKLSKHVKNIGLAMGTGEWTIFPSEEAIKAKLRGR